ncbi:MAG: hypothetical protein ACKOC4_04245, partial [Planctomycetia bacterium]
MAEPSSTPPATTAVQTRVHLPPSGRPGFTARAVLAGTGIDLAALGATDRTGATPLVVELVGFDGGGLAMLFRYGAVVFFHASPAAITEYLRQIGPHIRQPFAATEQETELLEIRVDPAGKEAVKANVLVLAEATLERLQLV